MNPPPPVDAAISATGVRKDYGDRAVLRGVDLSVPWGEIAVLFGANGAGKTTLLRILAGLTRPDSGDIHIAGRLMRRQGNAARRLVGFLGHQTLLYNDLTCRENLRFYGQLYGLKNADRRIAAHSGTAEPVRPGRPPGAHSLSHGMQKRLAMARAILHEPALLLLDEPESGLDATSVATLGAFLREWAASGRSALLTTHSEQVGLAWASRTLLLAGGRLTRPPPITPAA